MRDQVSAKKKDNGFSKYFTFNNVVVGLCVVTFLIFLGGAISLRIAFLFAALLALMGIFWMETSARRKWEDDLLQQLKQMSNDHERLVREVARNRNDLSALKKTLAEAGDAARNHKRSIPSKLNKEEGSGLEQRMISALAEQLSQLGKPTTGIPSFTPGETVESISSDQGLTDEQVIQFVSAAVQQDRIDLFLQPIVNLPQRKVRFFEMFSRIRIRPEVYLPAERYIAIALRNDLAPAIDNLLLLRGLQLIRDTAEEDLNRAYFCNITSVTLNDPKFMGDLVDFIANNRTLAPRLVFELGQRDLATMSSDILPVLEGLSQLGCRFSMDQVKSISFDFAHLEARHIRFIKINAGLMLRELKEDAGYSRLKRMKAEFDANGIDLIVEKIETDRQLLDLLDIDIDYGQGFLFGKPELSRNT